MGTVPRREYGAHREKGYRFMATTRRGKQGTTPGFQEPVGGTLADAFRRWLAAYAQRRGRMDRYEAVMQGLRGKLKVGRKLSRESMNER